MNSTPTLSKTVVLTALLALFFFLSIASTTFVVFQHRALAKLRSNSAPTSAAGNFVSISEDSIPGQYHWFEDDRETGVVVLNGDHSVVSTTGAKNARFRWALQSEGLLVMWGNPFVLFNQVTAPGHYVGTTQGKIRQMQKVP